MVQRGPKGIKLIHNFLQITLPRPLTASSKLSGTPLQQLLNMNFIAYGEFDTVEKIFI
jgi:hypothetical protein